MKKISFILGVFSTALFCNCTQQESDIMVNETNKLTAVMECIEKTKSDATDEGVFTWTKGDKITIHTTSGNYREGALIGNGGSSIGAFQYTLVGEETESGYAVYPHNSGHKINANGSISVVLPESYALGETLRNTNAIMLASPSSAGQTVDDAQKENSYVFNHLAGVMRFKFKNVPAGTDKFELTLGGSKINGAFTVENDQITTEVTGEVSEQTTTLSFVELAGSSDITLFVPVPVGTYTGATLKFYAEEEVVWSFESTATNIVARRNLVRMPELVISSASGEITNYVGDAAALSNALTSGGTITMKNDIGLESNINVPASTEVTLDLNGNNLDNGENTIFVGEGATLNLVNTAVVMTKSGNVTDATITSTSDIIKASKDATITIGEGVSLTTTGQNSCCVWIPSGAENVILNTEGNLRATTAGAAVISHNGYLQSGEINITGGTITHDCDVAVYIAGNAKVNVSGEVAVSGTTALEIRAGELIVNGGSFTATADEFKEADNANGTTSEGAAVAICKHNTNHDLSAVINGGSFTGKKSVHVNSYDSANNVSLVVNGGAFSDPNACYYLGQNANVTVNMINSYEGPGFVTSNGQTVNLNIWGDNTTYTVTDPLVGSAGTQTLGFQFKQGSTVSINGGKITSSAAKMLINNYTDLTLDNVTLAPEVPNLDIMKNSAGKVQTYYVLSNNSGTVNLNGTTTIKAPKLDGLTSYAFDVCKYASYAEPKVIWGSTGTVDGDIELSGGTFELANDLNLTGVVMVTGTSTVNLKDNDITSGGDVFDVAGGTLTVNGTDEAKVTAKSGVGSTCAVWVHANGKATINGGHYSVGADKDGNRNDCIYAGRSSGLEKGIIDIYGGKFEYTGPSSDENEKDGDKFLLNGKDRTNSKITVYGGVFKNHVPGKENTAPAGEEEVVVAGEGKKVYLDDKEISVAHSHDKDCWYTVK